MGSTRGTLPPRPPDVRPARRLGSRILLALVSVLVGLVVAEAGVRLLTDRYEAAANGAVEGDGLRIFRRRPDDRVMATHPDRAVTFPVIYNALGLRHDREVPPAELARDLTVGVFGDSTTENLNMPAAYNYVELLDYLLGGADGRATALNFGVSGYGTDQSYLAWREWARDHPPLDLVVYMLCSNDLRNVYENNLFDLTEDGQVTPRAVEPRSWWLAALSRLHLTYLLLDALHRFDGDTQWRSWRLQRKLFSDLVQQQKERRRSPEAQAMTDGARYHQLEHSLELHPEMAQAARLLTGIIDRWRAEVTARGGRFVIVLYPGSAEHGFAPLLREGHDLIDLYALFRERLGEGYALSDFKFVHDGHWNEEGNQLGAIELYDPIARRLGVTPMAPEAVEEALHRYYEAIATYWRPTRWTRPAPLSPAPLSPAPLSPAPLKEQRAQALRRRYQELVLASAAQHPTTPHHPTTTPSPASATSP